MKWRFKCSLKETRPTLSVADNQIHYVFSVNTFFVLPATKITAPNAQLEHDLIATIIFQGLQLRHGEKKTCAVPNPNKLLHMNFLHAIGALIMTKILAMETDLCLRSEGIHSSFSQ